MNVNVGSLIRRERQKQGISLRELARRVGISGSMLSQVETDRTRPSVSTIYAIATELGLSIDALLSEAGEEPQAAATVTVATATTRWPSRPYLNPMGCAASPPPSSPASSSYPATAASWSLSRA